MVWWNQFTPWDSAPLFTAPGFGPLGFNPDFTMPGRPVVPGIGDMASSFMPPLGVPGAIPASVSPMGAAPSALTPPVMPGPSPSPARNLYNDMSQAGLSALNAIRPPQLPFDQMGAPSVIPPGVTTPIRQFFEPTPNPTMPRAAASAPAPADLPSASSPPVSPNLFGFPPSQYSANNPSPYQDSGPIHFGWRINNPGNITAENPKAISAYPGAVGTYSPGNGRTYLKFATPEQGLAAIGQTLASYGTMSVKDAVTKYAGSYNPNYVNSVAAALGVSPDTVVNFRDPRIAQAAIPAITKFETGQNPPIQFAGAPVPSGSPTLGATAAAFGNPLQNPAPPPAAPAAAPVTSAAAPATPARTPYDWGPMNPLWGTLTSLGGGLLQPTRYGFGGALSQGLTQAGQFAQNAPLRMLQMKKLQAETSLLENKSNLQSQLNDFAKSVNLPDGVRAALLLNPSKALDILQTYDPAVAKQFINFQATKAGAIRTAEINAQGGMSDASRLQRDYDAAVAAGDTQKASLLKAEIDKRVAQSSKAQSEATVASAGIQRAQQGIQDFERANARLFKDGKVDRTILAASDARVPFSEGRTFEQELRRAVSSFIFAVGGKQLTENEWNLTYKPLMPNSLDSDEAVRRKMAALRQQLTAFAGNRPSAPASADWNTSSSGLRYRVQ